MEKFHHIQLLFQGHCLTKIINRSNGEITKGRIPPYSVVVPGTYKDLYAVHIIKTVDSKTRSKTSINDLLRD